MSNESNNRRTFPSRLPVDDSREQWRGHRGGGRGRGGGGGRGRGGGGGGRHIGLAWKDAAKKHRDLLSTEDAVYAIVHNIPKSFHSRDLRRFFNDFVEKERFVCFNFQHRPEQRVGTKEGEQTTSEKEDKPTAEALSAKEDKPTAEAVSAAEGDPSTATKAELRTLCCPVKMTSVNRNAFIEKFHGKFWTNDVGKRIPLRCIIQRIKMTTPSNAPHSGDTPSSSSNGPLNLMQFVRTGRGETTERQRNDEEFLQLREFKPSALIPQGNVGTPIAHIMHMIEECRLPPSAFKRLGLNIESYRQSKKMAGRVYTNVDVDYGDGQMFGRSAYATTAHIDADNKSDTRYYKGYHGASTSAGRLPKPGTDSTHGEHWEDIEARVKEEERPADTNDASDDDECEEWDRAQAFGDDPITGGRNKAKSFEQEEEVTWEKGGPGLVFYTDEFYWQSRAGDTDEQWADDWDVDMSIYYSRGEGDRDAKDMADIRRNEAMAKGGEEGGVSVFKSKCSPAEFGFRPPNKRPVYRGQQTDKDKFGDFEKFTTGVGSKIMKSAGWKEGEGLGSQRQGKAESIAVVMEDRGQSGSRHVGFGYAAPSSSKFGNPRARRQQTSHMISTIYDDRTVNDPKIADDRRGDITRLSYR